MKLDISNKNFKVLGTLNSKFIPQENKVYPIVIENRTNVFCNDLKEIEASKVDAIKLNLVNSN